MAKEKKSSRISEKLKIRHMLWLVFIMNVALMIFKYFLWLYTNLDSLKMESVNAFGSIVYCFLALISLGIINYGSRVKSPHGYGRLEYVATLFMALIAMGMGTYYFMNSVTRYPFPSSVIFSVRIMLLLLSGAILKIGLGIFLKMMVKNIKTTSVKFIASLMIVEGITGLLTVLAYSLSPITPFSIDAMATTIQGMIFSFVGMVYVILSAQRIIGRDAKASTLQQIREIVKEHDRVIGLGNLILHDYGPRHKEATFEVVYDYAFASDVYETNAKLEAKILDELNIRVKIIAIKDRFEIEEKQNNEDNIASLETNDEKATKDNEINLEEANNNIKIEDNTIKKTDRKTKRSFKQKSS